GGRGPRRTARAGLSRTAYRSQRPQVRRREAAGGRRRRAVLGTVGGGWRRMTDRDSDDALNPKADRSARVARDPAGSSCPPQADGPGEAVTGHCNPLKLAATLHWHPDDGIAARNIESKRLLDYWLLQLDHFDPIFAPEYLEAPALLGELLIEEVEH